MAHLPALIKDLALILSAAAIITLIFKRLKQPVVLGYIIAGLLVGPNFKLFPTVIEIDSIKTWADIGVIFLLFALGLEFSFKKLIRVGGVATVSAFTEVTLTLLLGFGIGRLLGWNNMNSLFFGGILSIASTTIIIRAFDELGVKNQKFAGIVTGVLIIEDLVAVLLMVLLSTVAASQTFSGGEMIKAVLKLVFFLVLWFVSGIFFIPTFFRRIRILMHEETLLIISLALCFVMVVLATYVGFSSALGAFIMGSILAETTKAEKIEHLVKSIKDLFGAIFFVSVGMMIDPQTMLNNALPILAATLVLLLGKPLFVTMGTTIAGQPLKIAVQSGMSLSQIGEFSFIIASLGLSLNVTSDFLYPVAVAVSVLTTFTTPFMIRFSEPVFKGLDAVMPVKWKNKLNKYSFDAQRIIEISDWKKVLKANLINAVIFSVIIITVILLSTRYLEPIFHTSREHQIVTAIVTLVVLAPFLWALAFRRMQRQAYANVWSKVDSRGPLLLLQVSRIALTIMYIGFFFYQLFSPVIALWGVLVACLIIAVLSKRIQMFYGKIEKRFLINYHERESGTLITNEILTPWDTHITKFELNAQYPYIGKTLSESKLREEFGINIVKIIRGDFVINFPTRVEHLFPNDQILVLGTDEQLTNFKAFLELSISEPDIEDVKQRISLHHFTVSESSSLVGQNIRNSEIRERCQGLVVGVERNGQRIVNPESDLIFEVNDTVWVVGNETLIQSLIREMAGS